MLPRKVIVGVVLVLGSFAPRAAVGGTVATADTAAETQMVLRQVLRAPVVMDSVWLDSICEYIHNQADLESYYQQLLEIGARARSDYVAREKSANRVPSSDPRYFIELARKELYSRHPSVRKIDRTCLRNLATGLYMERQAAAGLDSVDEVFMEAFLKELVHLYDLRRELARARGEDESTWAVAQQRALEVGVVDRIVRLQHRHSDRTIETDSTAAGRRPYGGVTTAQVEKSLFGRLLRLGQENLRVAEAEAHDLRPRIVHARRAYSILARVYRWNQSPAALEGLRKATALERLYFYRMARIRWKRAQLSVAAGDDAAAAEHYYWATSYFNKALVRSVGEQRESITRQFRALKREVARWHERRQQGAAPAAGGR